MIRHIQTTYSGLAVDVTIQPGITLLNDNAATGKTFLMRILCSYFSENNIAFQCINYTSIPKSHAMVQALLEDNADLFMDNYLWEKLRTWDGYSVIAMKGLEDYSLEGVNLCTVEFLNDSICVKRLFPPAASI